MKRGSIEIVDGRIAHRGADVGRVDHELKFGYHPVVRLRMGATKFLVREWEVDESGLVDKIFAEVRKELKR